MRVKTSINDDEMLSCEGHEQKKKKQSKLDAFCKKAESLMPATNSYKLNRDLTILIAMDLKPFAIVNDGFKYFLQKIFLL